MTQDVRQWLAEIKSLQQKLAEVRQERDEAYNGAANWRKLYEQEAQQRRTEAHLSQQMIESLKEELAQLHQLTPVDANSSLKLAQIEQQLEYVDAAALKRKLADALLEKDSLLRALKLEQAEHNKTRSSLTMALGDTIDQLTRERLGNGPEAIANGNGNRAGTGTDGLNREGVKTPSPGRPSEDPAQSPT